jgi:hypothetical protein
MKTEKKKYLPIPVLWETSNRVFKHKGRLTWDDLINKIMDVYESQVK